MIKIVNDLYDIAGRVKEIDRGYEIFYNRNKGRYEVFKEGVLQSVLPFGALDDRAVRYLRKTRVENIAKLLDEMDADNLKRTRAEEAKREDERRYKTASMVSYLEKNKGYVPCYDEI